jgi:hypothetical protein
MKVEEMKGSINLNSTFLKFRNKESTQASSADFNSTYQGSNSIQSTLYEEIKNKLARAYHRKSEESFTSFFSTYENMISKSLPNEILIFD